MATFDLPELPVTRATPHLLMGAASPLWSYYGAAAASGVAYWWMTRWMQPMNLEALFAMTRRGTALAPMAEAAPLFEAMAEPAVEALEIVAEATQAMVEATADVLEEALPAAPVGGEAAPFGLLTEALIEAAPEPVVETVSEPVEAAPEPLAVEHAPETPMMEATADPLPPPVAKPRVRKTPPANGIEA